MHLPTWWATWVANARIMFGNNKCWFKEILDGWYHSKYFHLGPWCATDHVTHQPGIKPEPCFLCINLRCYAATHHLCSNMSVSSFCAFVVHLLLLRWKKNNLWDIGKKYWTWPFQVVYFPMIEIDFFWILYLTLQVMNSSTSSRLLTNARVRSSGKPRNGLWFLTKLNKCYQPRWDDEHSWDRHSPNVNLIDHPSRGWHSVKHVRRNLSGHWTIHITSTKPGTQIFPWYNIYILFCLLRRLRNRTLLHFLSSAGFGLVGRNVFFWLSGLLVHLDNVASQFRLGLFGLTNGKLPHQDHIDKDAKGPPRVSRAGVGQPNRMVKGHYIRLKVILERIPPIEMIY